MSITPVPISIRRIAVPIAASSGNGAQFCRAPEVVDADEGPVDADRLGGDGELDGLAQPVGGGRRPRPRRAGRPDGG
jgi:hypothetical protein